MVFPNYQIVLISCATGNVKRIFDGTSFYEMRFNRVLDDVGSIAITFPIEDSLPTLFLKDDFIEIRRTSPITGELITEETYLVRLTQRFRENNDERWVVGGLSLNHLIARRVIDPADDPLAAGGFSTKAGTADEVMRGFAREQMADLASVARRFPNFSVGLTPGTAQPVGKRSRYDNLLEVFQDLSLQGQTDFIIVRYSGNSLRLNIQPIGVDRTKTSNYPFAEFTQFDPDRGNLTTPSLVTDSKKEQNFCYALGQGQGDTRIVAKVAGDNLSESPYNRIEFTADIRQSDRSDPLYLLTGARAALTENQVKQEFTFEIIQGASGTVYRKDYDLGDKITVRWESVSIDLRVTGIEISLDASEGENISTTLEPYQI